MTFGHWNLNPARLPVPPRPPGASFTPLGAGPPHPGEQRLPALSTGKFSAKARFNPSPPAAQAWPEIGLTNAGWGAPDGFANSGAFVPGETRYFQLFYRDDASEGCMTGQNTSQAVRVPFTP